MFGGSGPYTKRSTDYRTWAPVDGPKAPIRRPSIKTPVRKLSSAVPEAVGTALPMVNVVPLSGPVAIEGAEFLRAPVLEPIPNLPTHPNVFDLLEESSFAPCHPRRKPSSRSAANHSPLKFL